MNFYDLQLKEIVDVLHDDTLLLDSILMHMGSGYTTLGKFDQAISLYTRSLKIIEQKFGMCLIFGSLIFGYDVSFVKLSIASISIIFIYRFTNTHIIGNLILGTLFLTILSKRLILDLMLRYCQ